MYAIKYRCSRELKTDQVSVPALRELQFCPWITDHSLSIWLSHRKVEANAICVEFVNVKVFPNFGVLYYTGLIILSSYILLLFFSLWSTGWETGLNLRSWVTFIQKALFLRSLPYEYITLGKIWVHCGQIQKPFCNGDTQAAFAFMCSHLWGLNLELF